MRARLHDLTMTRKGEQILSLVLAEDFSEKFDELREKDLTGEVKRYRPKRSKNANDYLWALCTEIAKSQRVRPEDVYRKEIREAGVSAPMVCASRVYERTARAWSERGIGWFCEKTDEADGWVYFLAYYGSSSYDTAEMSAVIENTVSDAKALGIETASERELSLLYEDWSKR